jgi:hypothetical protein
MATLTCQMKHIYCGWNLGIFKAEVFVSNRSTTKFLTGEPPGLHEGRSEGDDEIVVQRRVVRAAIDMAVSSHISTSRV